MKTKITTTLALLAVSVFALAESVPAATEAPKTENAPLVQTCAQPDKCCKLRVKKFAQARRPQVSPEMREAFVQRMLLSLSEEDLAKLAEKVAAVQKMTPEQKAEALKALPKPEFRPNNKRMSRGPAHHGPQHGKPMPPRCENHGKPAPECAVAPGKRPVRRGPGIMSCCGGDAPKPIRQESSQGTEQLPPPPPPAK